MPATSLIVPPFRESLLASMAMPSVSESPSITMYLKVNCLVFVPMTYQGRPCCSIHVYFDLGRSCHRYVLAECHRDFYFFPYAVGIFVGCIRRYGDGGHGRNHAVNLVTRLGGQGYVVQIGRVANCVLDASAVEG